MQITLNQQDILNAVQVYLESLMKKPIDVTNLDIKGMRTVEGYTATVDLILDGQVTQPIPKPVNAVQPVIDPNNGVLPDDLTADESEEWTYIANLLAHNPRGINDNEIVLRVESASDAVYKKAQENTLYQAAFTRYEEKSKPRPEYEVTQSTGKPNVEKLTVEPDDSAPAIEEEIPPVDEVIKPDEQLQEQEEKQEEMVQVQVGTNILGQPIYELKPKSEVNNVSSEATIHKGMFS